jgi:hypothetical protein
LQVDGGRGHGGRVASCAHVRGQAREQVSSAARAGLVATTPVGPIPPSGCCCRCQLPALCNFNTLRPCSHHACGPSRCRLLAMPALCPACGEWGSCRRDGEWGLPPGGYIPYQSNGAVPGGLPPCGRLHERRNGLGAGGTGSRSCWFLNIAYHTFKLAGAGPAGA